MSIYRYPPEVHEFVKKWSPKLRDRDLAEACNRELGTSFTESSMKSFRGNHGYRNGQKQWTHEEYWKYQTYYPKGMYEFIRDNSWGVSSAEMAKMVNEKFGLNLAASTIKTFRARHKIKSGCTGWFQKGRSPGNKGKRIDEYMSPETAAKVRKTAYKKGHTPVNKLPVGTISMSGGYKIIKKQMEGSQWERWKLLHKEIWEQHNGPIPDDKVLLFKDGNPMNCTIDNLMLASRSELMTANKRGLRFEDPDLTETAINVIRLQQAAIKRRKKK